MKKPLIRISITTLVVLLAPTVLLEYSFSQGVPEAVISPAGQSKTELKFTAGNSGEIDTEDGIRLGFTNYKASDGVNLRVFYWDFQNVSVAAQAFEKEVARAAKVIERLPKHDEEGKAVGERAVVLFPPVKPQPPLSAVIWTDGRSFHEIQSRSCTMSSH